MKYPYRHRETYNDVKIDVKANSKEELNKKVAEKKRKIDCQYVDDSISLKAFTEMYLETYKRPMVDSDYYSSLESMARIIVSGIGNIPVKRIKPMQVQGFLNSCSDHSIGYIRKIYHLTCQILNHAYKNGITAKDLSTLINLPKGKPSKSGRSLTDHEREILLQVIDGHRGEIFIKFCLYCGLRPGEVEALIWKDIDFKNESVTINKSQKRDTTVGLPKSDAAFRTVPIPEHFLAELKKIKADPFDRVCLINGLPYNEGRKRAMWKSVKREMNIAMGCRVFNRKLMPPYPLADDFIMYNLRHTYCTDLERKGVPINIARRLMGHSSITMTSKIYTHESDESFNLAKELINGKRETARETLA